MRDFERRKRHETCDETNNPPAHVGEPLIVSEEKPP
jgi:hypothetical protein